MGNEYIEQYYHFIQHLKMAENYHSPYLLEGGANIARNPILEQILPSLLYVQLASLFDEGLLQYIDTNELLLPKKKYKNDMNGRIQFLSDNRLIKDSKECHRIRKKRNDIAHESAMNISWDDLNNDLSIVELELKYLGLINDRPNYVFYAERAAARDSKEENVICAFDYYIGLKEDSKKIIEISWTTKMMKS